MSQAPQPDAGAAVRNERRKRLFTILGLVVAVAAVITLLYWLFVGSHRVSTDDAYVQADTAQVTSLVTGAVIRADAREMQQVKAGQVLAVIDPSDYQLAVARARADLGQAERKVRQYYATDVARSSDIARANAALSSARAALTQAQVESRRRHNLAASGAVSGDELTEAETRLQSAQASLSAAQAGVAQARANAETNRILTAGTTVEGNPEVAAARAHLNQAELDLSRTVVRAPIAGLVAKKSIQLGQRVEAGSQMMAIVPVQSAFVDANFKEVQLRKIHLGSPAVLTSDVYGGGVKFHGKVVGVAGGSGSAFALIPAQNATGNWIKVVQRVPVRITLDPRELAEHPLRVGVSMKVVVDVAAPGA
jgi:membrane fusion protein (multidrug efflux system)